MTKKELLKQLTDDYIVSVFNFTVKASNQDAELSNYYAGQTNGLVNALSVISGQDADTLQTKLQSKFNLGIYWSLADMEKYNKKTAYCVQFYANKNYITCTFNCISIDNLFYDLKQLGATSFQLLGINNWTMNDYNNIEL